MQVVPQRLGKYQLLKKIAQGGSAEVYLAENPSDPKVKYAIKMLRPKFSQDVKFISMLRSEYQTLHRLKHPNIVATHDFQSEGDLGYCVLEYIDGPSLHRLLKFHESKQRAFPEAVALHLAEQITGALAFIHQQPISDSESPGLLHSDLNAKNILLTRAGQIKLIDISSEQAEENRRVDPHGMGRGILDYMSPEQLEGKGIDAKSEIFTTGVLLYGMLVGRKPFPGSHVVDVYCNIRGMPITETDIPGNIHPRLKKIIVTALAKNPKERQPDMESLQKQVQKILAASHPDFSVPDVAAWLENLSLEEEKSST